MKFIITLLLAFITLTLAGPPVLIPKEELNQALDYHNYRGRRDTIFAVEDTKLATRNINTPVSQLFQQAIDFYGYSELIFPINAKKIFPYFELESRSPSSTFGILKLKSNINVDVNDDDDDGIKITINI